MLSNEQKVAVETTEGPLLIIVGPGLGKTFKLVERIYKNVQIEKCPISHL